MISSSCKILDSRVYVFEYLHMKFFLFLDFLWHCPLLPTHPSQLNRKSSKCYEWVRICWRLSWQSEKEKSFGKGECVKENKVGNRESPRQTHQSPHSVHMPRLPNLEHLDTPWGLLQRLSGVTPVLMVMLNSLVGSMTVGFPAYPPTSQDKPSGSDQILLALLLGSHMNLPWAKC